MQASGVHAAAALAVNAMPSGAPPTAGKPKRGGSRGGGRAKPTGPPTDSQFLPRSEAAMNAGAK